MCEDRPRARWKRVWTPWRCFLLCLVLLELGWLVVPPPGDVVERWYSQGLFRVIASPLAAVQDLLPFSLSSVLIAGMVGAFVLWVWYHVRAVRAAGAWRLAGWLSALVFQWAVVLLFWMLLAWGAGYQRTPVDERWSLDLAPPTAEEVTKLRAQLLAMIQETAGRAVTDDPAEAIAAISESMERLVVARGEVPIALPDQVRASLPGVFLISSTMGMCMPPVVEPWVDGALDPVSFTRVAAHELGHVAGYNRESEATLMGYLAGLNAENDMARYAIALGIYLDLIRREPDPERYRVAWEALPLRAREDAALGWEIQDRYRIKNRLYQQVGYHAYDTYLKSQGIKEGMVNYSMGLGLFLGAWRNGLAAPRLHPQTVGES